MASARHARPKQSRFGATLLVLVALVALGLAVAVIFVDDPVVLQAAVVATAALAVVAAMVAWRASRRSVERSSSESRALQVQLADVRRELSAVRDVSLSLSAEVTWMRLQLQQYVLPISSEPEPVYPSLHLPLVRAAFGVEPLPVDASLPVPAPSEVPPTVSADSGSEGRPPRQLVDLTAAANVVPASSLAPVARPA